jgi:hypothetical protein
MTNNILTNVTSVAFYNYSPSLTGVKEIEWEMSDAWLKIAVPYNPAYVHQQIKPTAVTIKMTCLNYELLKQVLSSSNAYNFTSNLRTILPYIIAYASETDGTAKYITFNNVHVETIKVNKLTEKLGEAEIVVTMHSDNAVPS